MSLSEQTKQVQRASLLESKQEINSFIRRLRDKVTVPGKTLSQQEEIALEGAVAEREAIEVQLAKLDAGPAMPTRNYDQTIRIGQEERTYRPDSEQSGGSGFFQDLVAGVSGPGGD